jgi:hypothetical protein
MTVGYLFIAAFVVVAIYLGIRYFVRASQRFSGERIIICPETGKQAMVEVDVRHAALTSLLRQTLSSNRCDGELSTGVLELPRRANV